MRFKIKLILLSSNEMLILTAYQREITLISNILEFQ